jgi:hypothetical protein
MTDYIPPSSQNRQIIVILKLITLMTYRDFPRVNNKLHAMLAQRQLMTEKNYRNIPDIVCLYAHMV